MPAKLLANYWRWPDEFSEQVDVSPETLRRWKRLGNAPELTRIGRTEYVHHDAGHRWLEKNTGPAAT